MSGYRHEQGEWVDGLGKPYTVARFYVPGDDDDWMTCAVEPDGSLQRLWSRSAVYMQSHGPSYANIDAAMADVQQAHKAWLALPPNAWQDAIGVLNRESDE